MSASYTKLKSGDWGVRVTGTARVGDRVTVITRAGERKEETIEKVIWTGNGVSLCSVVSKKKTASAPAGRVGTLYGRRTGCACGSIEGQSRSNDCYTCRLDND